MRHPTILTVVLAHFFLSASGSAAGETAKKWTHGRSVCDPVGRQLLDATVPSPVDSKALEQALEYSLQDAEFVSVLKCFPDAGKAAGELSANLRTLESQVLPGLRATACEPEAKVKSQRLALIRDAAGRIRAAEGLFEMALEKNEEFQRQISAQVPAEGLAFDDCRAKAQRGWATARVSLNKLSCELGQALDRLEAFRERAEQADALAIDCSAPKAVQSAAAEPQPAPMPVMMVVPVVNSGYSAFTGMEPAPAASGSASTGERR